MRVAYVVLECEQLRGDAAGGEGGWKKRYMTCRRKR